MKEHPILFSAPMVLALLAGRKTVTRRLNRSWMKVKAGDRLWVREHWWACEVQGCGVGNQFIVFDDEWEGYPVEPMPKALRPTDGHFKWGSKASMHLPRYGSRITLEVLEDARMERLQDITDAEIEREGLDDCHEFDCPSHGEQFHPDQRCQCGEHSLVEEFARLWSTLHTKPGERWEDNPEVVRVGEFRRIPNGSH